LHTWVTAETHAADGELQNVAVNRVEFLKLRERARIPAVSKRDEQHNNNNNNNRKRRRKAERF